MTMAILDFNFDTKNIIIFHYPRYTGGKFIQNCLGLSDSVVFQRQSLAQAQIDGTFSFEDKKEYILKYIQKEDIRKNEYWSDLQLGCSRLFVDDEFEGTDKVGNAMGAIFTGKQHSRISDTVKFLSSDKNDKLLFSLNWHTEQLFPFARSMPNAKILTFKNNLKMTQYRTSYTTKDLVSEHWDEGNLDFANDGREPDFTWNTEWLNDVTITVDGLKELYELFNLSGWERAEPLIKEYYHIWYEKNSLQDK